MRATDDTVTGPAFVAIDDDSTIGRASIPCPTCGHLLAGDTCPGCRRTFAPARPDAPDEQDDPTDEQVMLGEMPGGQRRRGQWSDT